MVLYHAHSGKDDQTYDTEHSAGGLGNGARSIEGPGHRQDSRVGARVNGVVPAVVNQARGIKGQRRGIAVYDLDEPDNLASSAVIDLVASGAHWDVAVVECERD
jgi:hypothetical protein